VELYREGTLLRFDGELWMIMGRCTRSPNFHRYILQRLADSFIFQPVYVLVHREMELASEA